MDKPKKSGRQRKWLMIVTGLLVLALTWAALATSRLGYESPDYQVQLREAELELRRYPAMATVATTMTDASLRSGMNGGFGRLFGYITGENADGRKVAMTTPVLIDASEAGDSATMNFVLPSALAKDGAPIPTGESVLLRRLSAGEFAVIRFHGFRQDAAIAQATADLNNWIESNGWTAKDAATLAFYDPPWTPEFLRRNEVLIRVER